jgi:hypothetical protein
MKQTKMLAQFCWAYLRTLWEGVTTPVTTWAGTVFQKAVRLSTDKSKWVFLLFLIGSGLVDLGAWYCLFPYYQLRYLSLILVGAQVLHFGACLEGKGNG